MTFKNTKFDESAVMRSLERLAIAKGTFDPEEVPSPSKIATAATKVSETPKSLSEKILVLCDGLRSNGLVSYANEIEQKFLFYKKAAANSLYDVHHETGEDVIDFAHPDGGKKLDKGWDELGVIETISERHQKMVEVVNKQPKGKLASKHIINAVKIVLAQEADVDPSIIIKDVSEEEDPDETKASKNFTYLVDQFIKLIAKIQNIHGSALSDISRVPSPSTTSNEGLWGSAIGTTNKFLSNISQDLSNLLTMPVGADAVDELKRLATIFKDVINKADKISANHKNNYVAMANSIIQNSNKVLNILAGDKLVKPNAQPSPAPAPAPAPAPDEAVEELERIYSSTLQTITNLKTAVTAKNLGNGQTLLDLLDQFTQYVSAQKQTFDNTNAAQKSIVAGKASDNMTKVQNRLNAFKSKWGI
jgi:hypothetical protein